MSVSSSSRVAPDFDIRFQPVARSLEQDEEFFEFTYRGRTRKLRIHDYDAIYQIPGLYEALVYDTLNCSSPQRLADMLAGTLPDWRVQPADLRVLDLGAGNGVMAQELARIGVRRMVGLDLLPEAAMAAKRDRPDVYDDYLVADLTALSDEQGRTLRSRRFNCLVTAAALGFGDIPPAAFATAYNMVADGGWIAMTIKEDFLDPHVDESGFARMLRQLIDIGVIDMQAHQRYCHRVSVDGDQLFYIALVACKASDIPAKLVEDESHTDAMGAQSARRQSLLLG